MCYKVCRSCLVWCHSALLLVLSSLLISDSKPPHEKTCMGTLSSSGQHYSWHFGAKNMKIRKRLCNILASLVRTEPLVGADFTKTTKGMWRGQTAEDVVKGLSSTHFTTPCWWMAGSYKVKTNFGSGTNLQLDFSRPYFTQSPKKVYMYVSLTGLVDYGSWIHVTTKSWRICHCLVDFRVRSLTEKTIKLSKKIFGDMHAIWKQAKDANSYHCHQARS